MCRQVIPHQPGLHYVLQLVTTLVCSLGSYRLWTCSCIILSQSFPLQPYFTPSSPHLFTHTANIWTHHIKRSQTTSALTSCHWKSHIPISYVSHCVSGFFRYRDKNLSANNESIWFLFRGPQCHNQVITDLSWWILIYLTSVIFPSPNMILGRFTTHGPWLQNH